MPAPVFLTDSPESVKRSPNPWMRCWKTRFGTLAHFASLGQYLYLSPQS
jgi:hypothetical protein